MVPVSRLSQYFREKGEYIFEDLCYETIHFTYVVLMVCNALKVLNFARFFCALLYICTKNNLVSFVLKVFTKQTTSFYHCTTPQSPLN